jgi:hypothetical protein
MEGVKSMDELREENRRLRMLLSQATAPSLSSVGSVPIMQEIPLAEYEEKIKQSYTLEELDAIDNRIKEKNSPINKQVISTTSSGTLKMPKGVKNLNVNASLVSSSLSSSSSMASKNNNGKRKEKKLAEHHNKVVEAHWQGKQEGRYKPVDVVDKPSLRLKPKNTTATPTVEPTTSISGAPQLSVGSNVGHMEVNVALQPLPPTNRRVEEQNALITGIKPFLEGALQLDNDLKDERCEYAKSRSPSPNREGSRSPSPTNSLLEAQKSFVLPDINASHDTKGEDGMGAPATASDQHVKLLSQVQSQPPAKSTVMSSQPLVKREEKVPDLFCISSEFVQGLYKRPLIVSLLASRKPAWKTSTVQLYDPDLHLALFPPPPSQLVANVYDPSTNQVSNFPINVREHTALLYELQTTYKDRYTGREIDVSKYYHPSSLDWWSTHLKDVLVVRARGDGSLILRISKSLIDKVIQTHAGLISAVVRSSKATAVQLVNTRVMIDNWFGYHREDNDLTAPAANNATAQPSSNTNNNNKRDRGRKNNVSPPRDKRVAQPGGSGVNTSGDILNMIASDEPYQVGMFQQMENDTHVVEAAGETKEQKEKEMKDDEGSVTSTTSHDNKEPQSASQSLVVVPEKKKTTKKKKSGRSQSPSKMPPSNNTPIKLADDYKPLPGRSNAPGYFGNKDQKDDTAIIGYAWNDNTDIVYNEEHVAFDKLGDKRPELYIDKVDQKDAKGNKSVSPIVTTSDNEHVVGLNEDLLGGSMDSIENNGSNQNNSISPTKRRKKPIVIKKADDVARETIIQARELHSSSTKFRTRKLSDVEAGLFRSPFAKPLVTAAMRKAAEEVEAIEAVKKEAARQRMLRHHAAIQKKKEEREAQEAAKA